MSNECLLTPCNTHLPFSQCYLCGKSGHVRRECPGIADDGRGESKYTKSKGDSGAVHLKHSNRGRRKHNNNSNNKSSNNGNNSDLPSGFEKNSASFLYYDAGYAEGQEILEYLRFGRHGHGGSNSAHSSGNVHNHTQVSRKDDMEEYNDAMKEVCETTNFGGCILRSYLPMPSSTTASATDIEPWKPHDSFPFSCFDGMPSLLKFVVGYPLCSDSAFESDADVSTENIRALVDAASNHEGDVVGFFADLDYTTLKEPPPGKPEQKQCSSRDFQLKRLRSTLRAASKVDCPVQIRILPGYKATPQTPSNDNPLSEENNDANTPVDGYALAIRDLGEILLEASVDPWKVHLSSWNGKAEHLVALAGAFSSKAASNKLVFGFNGSLGFSKAVHLHESAFEVSPLNVVLETSGPGIVPPIVAKQGGRNAFCHSGHIPYVAEELAKHLSKNPTNVKIVLAAHKDDDKANNDQSIDTAKVTADKVALLASATTMAFYGLQ